MLWFLTPVAAFADDVGRFIGTWRTADHSYGNVVFKRGGRLETYDLRGPHAVHPLIGTWSAENGTLIMSQGTQSYPVTYKFVGNQLVLTASNGLMQMVFTRK